MLNKIIEGRYQTTNYYQKNNYQKIKYRSLTIFKDSQGYIVKFVGNYFSEIQGAVEDAAKYLRKNNIEGEYDLIFNNSKLYVSKDSDVDLIVKEYLESYRDMIFEA